MVIRVETVIGLDRASTSKPAIRRLSRVTLPPDERHVFEIVVFEIELAPRRTSYRLVNGEAEVE
jgi:hypothetical protein